MGPIGCPWGHGGDYWDNPWHLFWSLALPKMGLNPSGSSGCPSLEPHVILPVYLPQKTPRPMCQARQSARHNAITKPA